MANYKVTTTMGVIMGAVNSDDNRTSPQSKSKLKRGATNSVANGVRIYHSTKFDVM